MRILLFFICLILMSCRKKDEGEFYVADNDNLQNKVIALQMKESEVISLKDILEYPKENGGIITCGDDIICIGQNFTGYSLVFRNQQGNIYHYRLFNNNEIEVKYDVYYPGDIKEKTYLWFFVVGSVVPGKERYTISLNKYISDTDRKKLLNLFKNKK